MIFWTFLSAEYEDMFLQLNMSYTVQDWFLSLASSHHCTASWRHYSPKSICSLLDSLDC